MDEVLQCADRRRILRAKQIGIKKRKKVLMVVYQAIEQTEIVKAKLKNLHRNKAASIKELRVEFERERALLP